MRLKHLVSVCLLIIKVLAGGFAGALDRVWLYYAYQIDGLNDPAQRTLGWKCRSWDDVAKKCRIHKRTKQEWWVECKGSMHGRRCNFSELLNFLGGSSSKDLFASDEHGRLLDSQTTNPDPEETAKRVYAYYLSQSKNRVFDWQGYRVIYQGDNKRLFDRFVETTAQIKAARVGDHGPYLVAAMEQRLNPRGFRIEKEKVRLGHNPADPSQVWETVDWEHTMAGVRVGGEHSELETLLMMDEIREDFYSKDSDAQRHRTVIQSFEMAELRVQRCI
ncbi:hypothetical protein TgHK011_005742 [Trichoderma gracile]|nr:hypothetical protein TgHK011_005742 [Trichoderma gracile]